jgi:peptide/nickel transport system substrate-binding protein
MTQSTYWKRYWSRRRILSGAGLGAAGAASLALVGCGDDDDDGGSSGGLSNLATATTGAAASPTAVDPFAGATRGGTYFTYTTGDPPTIDPYKNLSFITKTMSNYVYSRLFKYKTGPGILRANARPTGDLALSAEASTDGLKWTIKMRPNIKFHNVAPVNGRPITSEDLKYSWARMVDPKNTGAVQAAFVDKVEFPDAATMVFTLKTPSATFLDFIADSNAYYILPTEAEGKFDASRTMIGSGPWLFDSYSPGINYKMKKNPDWHVSGFPLMDAVEVAIIPEYANYLAQFLGGNLDVLAPNAADLGSVQKSVKDVKIASYLNAGHNFLWFDGNDPTAPYVKDERIRQAISMALDRDALTEITYDQKKLKAAGLTVNDRWNNMLAAGWGRFWVDPKGPNAGPGGQFFKYNVAEAKKLLSAAGYTDSKPFETTYQYTANRYGKGFNDAAEAALAMLNAAGIKTNTDVQDYSSKYITQTFEGKFKGLAFGLETGFGEVGAFPNRWFLDNPLNHAKVNDPELTKLTIAQQSELNDEKRVAIFHEMQRYHATKMYYIPAQVGSGDTWVAYQKTINNGADYFTPSYGPPTETTPYLWKSKA